MSPTRKSDSGADAAKSLEAQAEQCCLAGELCETEELLVAAVAGPGAPASAFHNLGQVRVELGDFRGAISAYDHSVHQIPEGRLNRGLSHERLGEIDAARNDYEQVLADAPNDIDALVNLGTLELASGDLPSAERLLAQAATLDPIVSWQLSDVHIAKGDVLGARRALLASFLNDWIGVERPRGGSRRSSAGEP